MCTFVYMRAALQTFRQQFQTDRHRDYIVLPIFYGKETQRLLYGTLPGSKGGGASEFDLQNVQLFPLLFFRLLINSNVSI